MANEVGLGMIGLGWWGAVLAGALQKVDRAKLVSCFSRTAEKRSAFAEQWGCRASTSVEELFGDPEVEGVLVATSHSTHLGMIEAAASAGKHVFVEKPLALTVEDARACVDAAARAGVVLQVGHQRRRSAANRRIKRMIEAGELGDLQMLEGHQSLPNGFRMPQEQWRWIPGESPLGSMTSLGIHKVESFHYLAGPIRRVSAHTRSGRGDVSIDEATVLAVEFESGVLGTIATSFFTPRLSRLGVYGTGGAAFNEMDGTELYVQPVDDTTRNRVELESVDPVVDQLAEFVRAVRGDVVPETGGLEGLRVVAVLAAAVESARSGRAIDVET